MLSDQEADTLSDYEHDRKIELARIIRERDNDWPSQDGSL